MPNLKASKIDQRRSLKRNDFNRALRSRVRTASKKIEQLLGEKTAAKQEQLRHLQTKLSHLYQVVDKAVKKGVLKKNTAARQKGKFARRVAQFSSALPKNATPTPPSS